jgi:hypothetical protein
MAEALVHATQSTVEAGARAVRKRERKSLLRQSRQAPIPPGTYVKVSKPNAHGGRKKNPIGSSHGPYPVALVVAYDDKSRVYKLTWHSWGFADEDEPKSDVKGDVLRYRLHPIAKSTADRIQKESEERRMQRIRKESELSLKPGKATKHVTAKKRGKATMPESAVEIVESAPKSSVSLPEEYELDCVLGKKDSVRPMYLLKWVGYGTSWSRGDVRFEPAKSLSAAFILEGLPLQVLKEEQLTDDVTAKLYAARKLQLPDEAGIPDPVVVSLPITTMSCWLDCALVSLWCLRRQTRKLRFDADGKGSVSNAADDISEAWGLDTPADSVRRILNALSENPPRLPVASKEKQKLWRYFYTRTTGTSMPWPKIGQDGDPVLAMTSLLGEDLGRCADMKMRVLTEECSVGHCVTRAAESAAESMFILLPATEAHAADVLGCLRRFLDADMSVACVHHPDAYRRTKRVLETEPPTLLLVELGADFEEAIGKAIPKVTIAKRRLACGKCFSREYIPMASIHTPSIGHGINGVHFVAQIRLPAPARPGYGVWYTYDPSKGVCKLNANGMHDKKMGGMVLAVFMREDAIAADAASLAVDIPSTLESDEDVDPLSLLAPFPVEKFQLPYRDMSCWMDVCIVSVFTSLGFHGWREYHVADDRSVRRNEREFLLKMEEVWRCALLGRKDQVLSLRTAFWKWMESDPSFHAIFIAHDLPKYGMVGAPTNMLKCILNGCGALDLECWVYTEACACSKRTRSHASTHHIYIPRLNDLGTLEGEVVDLSAVVESLFSREECDLISQREKCKHVRRIRFEPTPFAVGTPPRGFIVQNDDFDYNKKRAKPLIYDVGDDSELYLFGDMRYEATAVISRYPGAFETDPGHFVCHVRVEKPLELPEWWHFDDQGNGGRLRQVLYRHKFEKNIYVVALVYTRVGDV